VRPHVGPTPTLALPRRHPLDHHRSPLRYELVPEQLIDGAVRTNPLHLLAHPLGLSFGALSAPRFERRATTTKARYVSKRPLDVSVRFTNLNPGVIGCGSVFVTAADWKALQTLFGDALAADQAMAVFSTGCEPPEAAPRGKCTTPVPTPAAPTDVPPTSRDALASYVAALPPGVQPAARDAAARILGTFGALFLGKDEPLPSRDTDRPWPANAHARIPLIDPAGKPPSLPLRRMSPDKLRLLYEDMAKLIAFLLHACVVPLGCRPKNPPPRTKTTNVPSDSNLIYS